MTWALGGALAVLILQFVWLAYREHDVQTLTRVVREQSTVINTHATLITELRQLLGLEVEATSGRHHAAAAAR